ncbi:septum formation initiator family protein [Chitinophaga pendula]|uniref:FtsB family cell division protein n=1 Tax=Chitinophaga TaxID=79328 RepID=UPI000BAF4B28|nr:MULTISPECIES: septum formation initiator family protein [Chitinophaga]ASZ10784.1 septum formation initiator [Chitinophaga sp. MD30]UCJ06239.1 septum formation initiator family protein [Chitinophaga pendula]
MPAIKSFKVPSYLRNKYFAAALAFVIWLAFLDRNNLLSQYQLQSEVNTLEGQKEFFKSEIDNTRKEQQELLSSPEKLEKFAREKYLMKKDNEDLFIVTETPKEKK